tara:strand:+ start:72 stop:668 length:597 start_codon:yes stop_codon:yes gene_type:complete
MNKVPTFISIYDNALSNDECNQMIGEFEISRHLQEQGVTAPSYKPNIECKISTDVSHNLDDGTTTSDILRKKLYIYCKKYCEEYPDINNHLEAWTACNGYNVQKYNPGEGYFSRHCEVNCIQNAPRVLVWMFYLNNVPDGGTEFPTYDIRTDAIEGRLVLWPSYWTHIHNGQVSHTTTKYIATGWYAFQHPDFPSVFD